VREGRRHEFEAFGWKPEQVPDPQARETFERSRLDFAELASAEHREMLDWYRALLALRRSRPDLSDGELRTSRARFDEAARWLVLERARTLVAVNLAERPQRIETPGATRVILTSRRDADFSPSSIVLPADAVAILDKGE
jgi:maltooligosyltrehalose trehalohydrolase